MKRRRTLKTGENEGFERQLHSWFERQRNQHVPVTREILCKKAKSLFAAQYGAERQFHASYGWYQKFAKLYSIRNLQICGEKLSSRADLVPQFKAKINNIIETEGFSSEQIYNADESALFYKMLPNKTLVHSKENSAPGRKINKERVTFLCCANKTGLHKLGIVVIGKSRNPRSFKKQAPIEYYSSKNGWMTSHIFETWFQNSFVPQVKLYQEEHNLPQKAILIIDNAPCHTKEELISNCKQYKTIFLPPNCTSIIQPMDQNAIRITKLFYKKSLLSKIINADKDDYIKFLKDFTIKDCCCMLKRSWEKLSAAIIKTCWSTLFPDEYDSEDDLPLSTIRERQMSVQTDETNDLRFFTETFNLGMQVSMNDEEVEDWINEVEEKVEVSLSTDTENEQQEENIPCRERIKATDAIQSLTTSIQWAEENNAGGENILVLEKLREMATEKAFAQLHQTTVLDFFQKPSL